MKTANHTLHRTKPSRFRLRLPGDGGVGYNPGACFVKVIVAGLLVGVISVGAGWAAAPEVKVQPQGKTIAAGGWVLLSVGAVGTSPLKYQWQKEGVAVNGATNVFLQVRVLGANQAGNYRVVVTNSEGSVTSAVAKVDWVARAYVTGWGEEVFFPLTGAKPIALAAAPRSSFLSESRWRTSKATP